MLLFLWLSLLLGLKCKTIMISDMVKKGVSGNKLKTKATADI